MKFFLVKESYSYAQEITVNDFDISKHKFSYIYNQTLLFNFDNKFLQEDFR